MLHLTFTIVICWHLLILSVFIWVPSPLWIIAIIYVFVRTWSRCSLSATLKINLMYWKFCQTHARNRSNSVQINLFWCSSFWKWHGFKGINERFHRFQRLGYACFRKYIDFHETSLVLTHLSETILRYSSDMKGSKDFIFVQNVEENFTLTSNCFCIFQPAARPLSMYDTALSYLFFDATTSKEYYSFFL